VILSTNTTCGTGDTVHKYHLQNRWYCIKKLRRRLQSSNPKN
jgi:hypothetical protein